MINLAKVLLESNQKSNELSMSRKCERRFPTEDGRTFTKVLGADKDKVHRDQTLENNNKDVMFDYNKQTVKRNVIVINLCHLCHDYYIYYVFPQTENYILLINRE